MGSILAAQVLERGQIGTPILFLCLRWKRVRNFGAAVGARKQKTHVVTPDKDL